MSPLTNSLVHAVNTVYPHHPSLAWFILGLLAWTALSLMCFLYTRWTEWFIGFVGGALFAVPVLMQFVR